MNEMESPISELLDEDMTWIREVFDTTIVPKLEKLHARTGVLSCQFAGERYKNWTLQFKETVSGFEILDFEYDEDAEGMDLDL